MLPVGVETLLPVGVETLLPVDVETLLPVDVETLLPVDVETFHGTSLHSHNATSLHGYQPFNGIVLTDTFQMFENAGYLLESIFPENNQRVINQKQRDITVIIGNPPYSAGQTSQNDNNQNLKYANLDEQIENSYAKHSASGNVRNLYDSYIRGFRWASDRIKDEGIICFVSNGSFIDSNNMDGFRKCLVDEFTSIYCFNLRGNQRTSGEQSRKEGGKIFGSGSRATIAIIFLIKNS
ncbi:MAG: Eco57I restriction-modification methylase domain-containing protein, partial [Dolichospermum sp.]